MKTIKKIKDNIGKVAGSALLVGATLAGGAAMVSAQDDSGSSGDLGDYPAPFVNDDGEVDTSVVVGEQATNGDPVSTLDVVAGIEVAGSLGNAAFAESETTVSGGSTGTWGATNGVTLDTRNDDVYFGQNLGEVRSTLTDGDLDVLADSEFRDDGSNTYDITHNLNVGTLPVTFGNGADELDNEDPAVHVELPSESSVAPGNHVMNLQASIDTIDVSDSDVAGEDIELFGQDYTIASEHSDTSGGSLTYSEDYLKLYGSSETISVETGQEQTVTIDGEDHTIEVVSVDASSESASLRVDGNIRQEDLDDEFDIDGQTVRIDEIINVGSNDDGNGIVELGIGSEELRVYPDGNVEDGDGDEVEGVYSQINGGDSSFDPTSSSSADISSLDFYVGAEDDDEDALMSGETFSHSLFDQVELHFGGLNPDASEEGEEVSFEANGDDTVRLGFMSDSGDEATIDYAYTNDAAASSSAPTEDVMLQDTDQDAIHTLEGAAVAEDEYFLADPGDFAHMWEVTGIDRDTVSDDSADFNSDDEAEIDLRDAVTGNTVTVDLDTTQTSATDVGGTSNGNTAEYYSGTEIIDGQEYHFVLEGNDHNSNNAATFNNNEVPEFRVSWGSSSGVTTTDGNDIGGALTIGDETSVSPALDTESGASAAFFEEVDVSSVSGVNVGVTYSDFSGSTTAASSDVNDLDSAGTAEVRLDEGTNVPTGESITVTVEDESSNSQTASISAGSSYSQIDLSTVNYNSEDVTVSVNGDVDTVEIGDDENGGSSWSADSVTTFNTDATATTSGNDLSGLELPSTESTDAQTGSSSQSLTFDSVNDYASFTVSGVEYEISDSEMLRVAGLDTSGDNPDQVASALILPEDDDDNEEAYVFEHGYDDSDEEVESKTLAQQPSTLSQADLESDDDVSAGYDFYGTYHEVDSDEQGSVMLHVPAGQSTVGAAVTGMDGELSTEGGGGSETVTASSPTYQYADGALDTDSSVSDSPDQNMVLVGGPAVNTLVADLAEDDQTWTRDEYSEGEGLIQMVPGAFGDNDAVIVAGHSGEDTRAAGEFLADYRNNAEALEGQTQVTVDTASGSVQ